MPALLLALELTAACAGQLPTRLPPVARRQSYAQTVDTTGTFEPVALPADSVWAILPGVYERLGLPIHDHDVKGQRMGTCWWRIHRRLAGAPLSRYLDCGEVRSVPNADAREVELLALTTVRPGPDGRAAVAIFVLGIASTSAGSADRLWCTSTGALETKIRTTLTGGP